MKHLVLFDLKPLQLLRIQNSTICCLTVWQRLWMPLFSLLNWHKCTADRCLDEMTYFLHEYLNTVPGFYWFILLTQIYTTIAFIQHNCKDPPVLYCNSMESLNKWQSFKVLLYSLDLIFRHFNLEEYQWKYCGKCEDPKCNPLNK